MLHNSATPTLQRPLIIGSLMSLFPSPPGEEVLELLRFRLVPLFRRSICLGLTVESPLVFSSFLTKPFTKVEYYIAIRLEASLC